MIKKLILILFIVLAGLVSADTVVEFVDGNFYLQKNSVWIELMPGESIPGGSVLRVGENSSVELSNGKAKFLLTNPGTFSIDSIILDKNRSSKAKSLIFNIIERLLKIQSYGSQSSPSTVLGVRAAEVPDDGFSWTSDGYAEYLELGKESLQREEYAEAKLNFSDALDSSFNDFEENEALFYLAYVEAVSGDPNSALSLLQDYSPDYEAPYYEQAVLLKANLLIEIFNSDKAIIWINTHKMHTADLAGSLLILEGLANLQLGDIDKAQKLFQNVIDNNFDSESVAIAAEYLDSM